MNATPDSDQTRRTDDLHRLACAVSAFVAAWETDPARPPDPAAYLPDDASPAFRRVVLVELIKADLDCRRRFDSSSRRLEDYLRDFPELNDADGPPIDLLAEEFHVRRAAGQTPSTGEYRARFPTRVAEIDRVLGDDPPASLSTRMPVVGDALDALDRVSCIDEFDLLVPLGRGGFARVFLARQRSMQRLVALKVSADRGAEPQTLARLDHPHIVRVFDQRILPEQGLRLLYMPYLPGGTLSGVVSRVRSSPLSGRTGRLLLAAIDESMAGRGEQPTDSPRRRWLAGLPWPQAVAWLGARLAEALAHAHSHGVLHRDVKPANVLLGVDGTPLLADFNVSGNTKLDGAGPRAVFGGSLAYMAPEHLEAYDPAHERRSDDLDGRCDVFSLGMTLWELLSGDRPFHDEQAGGWNTTLRDLVRRRRLGPAGELPADCPPALARVLRECLDPDPARRPDTPELARRLDLCLRPRTLALLEPPEAGWRTWALRRPVLAVLAAGVPPNAVAAVFNYVYNKAEIVQRLAAAPDSARVADVFHQTQSVINAVAFPVGIGLTVAIALPVAIGLRRAADGAMAPADLARRRDRSLLLGRDVVRIGLGCWLVAGIVYPVVLHIALGAVPAAVYGHFLASMALCGLIAAAWPFFTTTLLSIRVFYPALLRAGPPTEADARRLDRLAASLWPMLGLAAAVPLLGVGLAVLAGTPNPAALGGLSVAGLVGFAVAFVAARRIQADVTDLTPAAGRPGAGIG